jgi:hypothetical protein
LGFCRLKVGKIQLVATGLLIHILQSATRHPASKSNRRCAVGVVNEPLVNLLHTTAITTGVYFQGACTAAVCTDDKLDMRQDTTFRLNFMQQPGSVQAAYIAQFHHQRRNLIWSGAGFRLISEGSGAFDPEVQSGGVLEWSGAIICHEHGAPARAGCHTSCQPSS